MRVKLDETLKTCFAGREQPPPEVRAALEVALRAASGEKPPATTRERGRERGTRWGWAVMVYAALFSAAHLFVAWLFTNNEIIVGAFAVSFLFSTIGTGVIIVACQRERVKGGLNNGAA